MQDQFKKVTDAIAFHQQGLDDALRRMQIMVGLSPSFEFMAGFKSEPHYSPEEAAERAAVMESFEGLDQVNDGYWDSIPDRRIDVFPVDRPDALSLSDLVWMEDASAEGGAAL